MAEALDRVVGVSSDEFYGTTDAGYVSIRRFDSRYSSIDVDGNPISIGGHISMRTLRATTVAQQCEAEAL